MKRLLCAAALLLCLCLSAGVCEVAASGNHALYLDEDGVVWGWGANHRHETRCDSAEYMILTPQKLFENAAQIACGRQFSLVLDKDGNVWIWGDNSDGKLAETESVIIDAPALLASNVQKIAADESSYILLYSDGGAAYWTGSSLMSLEGSYIDVACGMDFCLLLDAGGAACLCGNGDYVGLDGDINEPTELMTGVQAVYAAGQSALLINDGEIHALGASGSEGRLGLNTTAWITTPTPNGVKAALKGVPGLSAGGAIDENGRLYVWGALYSLLSTFTEDGLPYYASAEVILISYGKTPILLYENVKDCAFGDAFALVELKDGTLIGWGTNDWGQAGDGTFTRFTMTHEEDDDGEDEFEISISDNRQKTFPVVVNIPR